MTIELKYRVNEACKDTCTYGMNFLNRNLEKIVEKSNPRTGERVALYRMPDGQGSRTVAAVEAYLRNSRKGDYDFYVLISGRLNELNEKKSLINFKKSLDNAVGKNGKATEIANYGDSFARDRRKTGPHNDRRHVARKTNQIFSGNFSNDVQNLLTDYSSGKIDNLSEGMVAIRAFYAPKPKSKSRVEKLFEGFVYEFFGFLLLP